MCFSWAFSLLVSYISALDRLVCVQLTCDLGRMQIPISRLGRTWSYASNKSPVDVVAAGLWSVRWMARPQMALWSFLSSDSQHVFTVMWSASYFSEKIGAIKRELLQSTHLSAVVLIDSAFPSSLWMCYSPCSQEKPVPSLGQTSWNSCLYSSSQLPSSHSLLNPLSLRLPLSLPKLFFSGFPLTSELLNPVVTFHSSSYLSAFATE